MGINNAPKRIDFLGNQNARFVKTLDLLIKRIRNTYGLLRRIQLLTKIRTLEWMLEINLQEIKYLSRGSIK